jgi:hypothetical protein
MGGACGTNGEEGKCMRCFGGERQIEISLRDLTADWRMRIKVILKK